jgi:hypothetical protein
MDFRNRVRRADGKGADMVHPPEQNESHPVPHGNSQDSSFGRKALKALIRRAAARTYDDLWRAVGHVCDLFTDEKCYNFFKAAGYETNSTRHACLMTDPAFSAKKQPQHATPFMAC